MLRQQISTTGITDPMLLPSMHSVLDFMEKTALESFTTGDADKDRMDRELFLDKLYAPTATDRRLGRGLPRRVPAGFEDAGQIEADFDSAMRALTGAR
ncbi:hypothetical protein [Mycolicibacterium sp.]|uniref:DUF7240 domain-containing protein n=1 Tax=Mycolicibacterium sp. TaxID=2320850 RepID=UPI003561243D